MGKFRFGVSLMKLESREAWTAKCRRAEDLGYDAITVPDHLGPERPGPLVAATMAAAVTERVSVGTLVSNMPFYNFSLFARDVTATALLSGGRFELGLGSGYMKKEFDDAGLPWIKAAERIEYLEQSIGELKRLVEGEMPPLLIAGNSDGVLGIAAEHAQIAGFAGLRQIPGKPPGTFKLDNADALEERVNFFRDRAGGREVEHNMLNQQVRVTDDRRATAQALYEETKGLIARDVDELLDAPQLLYGTVDEIIDQLIARRERYGFSYVTIFEPDLEAFAPVVKELSGQ